MARIDQRQWQLAWVFENGFKADWAFQRSSLSSMARQGNGRLLCFKSGLKFLGHAEQMEPGLLAVMTDWATALTLEPVFQGPKAPQYLIVQTDNGSRWAIENWAQQTLSPGTELVCIADFDCNDPAVVAIVNDLTQRNMLEGQQPVRQCHQQRHVAQSQSCFPGEKPLHRQALPPVEKLQQQYYQRLLQASRSSALDLAVLPEEVRAAAAAEAAFAAASAAAAASSAAATSTGTYDRAPHHESGWASTGPRSAVAAGAPELATRSAATPSTSAINNNSNTNNTSTTTKGGTKPLKSKAAHDPSTLAGARKGPPLSSSLDFLPHGERSFGSGEFSSALRSPTGYLDENEGAVSEKVGMALDDCILQEPGVAGSSSSSNPLPWMSVAIGNQSHVQQGLLHSRLGLAHHASGSGLMSSPIRQQFLSKFSDPKSLSDSDIVEEASYQLPETSLSHGDDEHGDDQSSGPECSALPVPFGGCALSTSAGSDPASGPPSRMPISPSRHRDEEPDSELRKLWSQSSAELLEASGFLTKAHPAATATRALLEHHIQQQLHQAHSQQQHQQHWLQREQRLQQQQQFQEHLAKWRELELRKAQQRHQQLLLQQQELQQQLLQRQRMKNSRKQAAVLLAMSDSEFMRSQSSGPMSALGDGDSHYSPSLADLSDQQPSTSTAPGSSDAAASALAPPSPPVCLHF